MKDIVAVVLAAGRGTRMKSSVPKVLHEILGKPVIGYVLDSLNGAGVRDIVTVTGFGNDRLKAYLKDARTVVQKELLGSGDAVGTAKKALEGYTGDVLVICGDTPLVTSGTISGIIEKHRSSTASLTVLTAVLKDPTGYGRIERDGNNAIVKIVEEEKAQLYEEVINEVNVGTYCFRAGDLFSALAEVKPDNRKREFFITDTVEILRKRGKSVESVTVDDISEMIGINSRRDLAEATRIMKTRVLERIMDGGVTIEDPASTTIYGGVSVGRDSVIRPNTVIESNVRIGERCVIGPFARIRPDVEIGDDVEVGNFVELVRARIGSGSKVKHHTYLGDATVGSNANIGAGTITANFDGKKKNKTVIGDDVFVGIGARLVAPVRIGKGALIGAGCVVLRDHDVPNGATAVGVPARILKRKKQQGARR